jgi:TraM recognition site of TraD and TraG
MRHSALRHSAPPHLPAIFHSGGTVAKGALCFFAGAAVGAALGHYLRTRRQLAWTWSLLGLAPPLALAAALIEGALSLSATSGFALAALLGLAFGAIAYSAHTRADDRRAGADREAAARRRRGVLDTPRRRLRERVAPRQRGGVLEQQLPLGRDRRGALVCIPRGTPSSGAHVLIPGATGAGKTTSLATLLVDYVGNSGFGAVVLEAKSDEALREAAATAAAERGVPFRLVSPEGPCGYDPLARGSLDERSERLIGAQEWGSADADFYRQAASPFLRRALEVLGATGASLSLARLARCFDPDRLSELAIAECPEALAIEVREQAKLLRSDERRAIAGMGARLRNLASSQFAGRWLDVERLGQRAVDLRATIGRCEVVYFRLDTDRTGNVGRAIAQMALLDLGAAASSMMGDGVGTFLAIDEFGALEASALERLFARGRAAGFSVAVGTQTLADLRAAGPAVRERVGATVSAVVCHRIGGQEDAEWIAELIGTVPGWETTLRTGRWGMPAEEGTRTRGHEFEVHPSELQRLAPGEAVIARLDGSASRRSGRVRVVPVWERFAARRGPHERKPGRARKEK